MRKLSKLAENLKPSATVAITTKAKEMKSSGIDVIAFSIGEPDFDTPDYIKAAAKKAIDEGFTKYTPASGIKELRDAICKKFEGDNNLKFSPDEIIATSGAKQAISLVIQVMCEAGDEVVIPSPYWVSYPEQVKLTGAKPVIVPALEKDGFKLSVDALASAVTERTKLIILNSPSNPTGVVYDKSELEAISEIVLSKGIFVISDEIYEKIVYGAKHVSIASLGKDIREKTIIVNGVSKTYAMTGWRVGYAAGDKEIISAMIKLQSQLTSHPDSVAQMAALAALEGSQNEVTAMRVEFEKRRDYIVDRVRKIGALSCVKPEGAFYVFPGISSLLGNTIAGRLIENSMDFAELLLDEAKVAVVPGAAFGSDAHIRISYAASLDKIKTGMDRIEEVVSCHVERCN
jgi:aspartate aminotransferase